MINAFHKDIMRSIKKGWKRFISILIITALGVGMLTGLYASSLDMYYSADQFFDKQNLFDIRILSTLGLTQEDVDVLKDVEGVEAVEGGYIETVLTVVNGIRKSADMTVLSRKGINMPKLLKGTLPKETDEIAVTQKYLDESGKSIGEKTTIEPEEKTNTFANTIYTITGVVLDPKDIRGNEDTGLVFRTTVTADYSFFITEEAAGNDFFTAVYIILSETKQMNSYSDEYEKKVQSVVSYIENHIKTQQEQVRYDEIIKETKEKIAGQHNLADAYAELENINKTMWFVQDRTSLDSYSSLKSDLSSIEAVGRLFPIIFLLVAVLMSLTTMTRMVEEERELIGTYMALGFTNAHIYLKYILFAFMACLLGGILGDLFGFIFMPRFISTILESLYKLPHYYLLFDPLYGFGGVVLFMVAVVGSTILSCRSGLRQSPATLLRPKAPRSGSRVWLERITYVWNHLNFLNKVTVRNLFRYKKRLFMTIGGIMGCTALIVCGFAIKDSVMNLSPNQYNNIYKYDLMVVFEEKDNNDIILRLEQDDNIKDYLNLRIENVKLMNADGDSTSVQLMVVPNGNVLKDYINIVNPKHKSVHLDDGGIFITENASKILNLKAGDTISMQNMKLDQGESVVSSTVRNHLGNNLYMTQKLYESLFGVYKPNGILANLSDACTNHADYAKSLLDNHSVLSSISTAVLRDDFKFDLLNAIVLLLIILAGGLAFVVLFTLATTNISERVRELATVKVLGFYDKEVYQYVNKETLILTTIGIILGLPAGRILSGFLIAALNIPSIHFTVYISPASYLFSVAITLGFTLIVNLMTNRSLNHINMVEALKSVE